MLLKAKQTFVIIKKSITGDFVIEKISHWTIIQRTSNFQDMMVIFIENSPKTTEKQKDMLWTTVGLNQPNKTFFVNF